jgi:hypothetical protein
LLKKITILFLLFNYLNTSVFLPEIVPITSVNSAICPTNEDDEINSLVEFIIDKCLATNDQTPEDEDDDIPDSNKVGEKEGIEDHICNLVVFSLPIYTGIRKAKIPLQDENKSYFVFISLHYSPPELA